jgi:hypothetical protein
MAWPRDVKSRVRWVIPASLTLMRCEEKAWDETSSADSRAGCELAVVDLSGRRQGPEECQTRRQYILLSKNLG